MVVLEREVFLYEREIPVRYNHARPFVGASQGSFWEIWYRSWSHLSILAEISWKSGKINFTNFSPTKGLA